MDDIVRPSWLLAGLTLRPQGTTTRDGRAVHQVRGLPRLPRGGRALRTAPCDYVDMLVDAELGLVLRLESVFGGRTRRVVELRDLTVDPPQADDPAAFRPPPGTDIDGEFGGGGPPDFGLEVDASERDPSRSWPGTTDVPFGMGALARSSAHAHRSTF